MNRLYKMNGDQPPIATVIMAAGKGTRMQSDLPKVMHNLAGRPLLAHVIETARKVNPSRIVIVVGHGRDLVMDRFRGEGVEFAVQEPQLGTGHAIARTEPVLGDFAGLIITLSGDVPLLGAETLKKMIQVHQDTKASLTVLTCEPDDPGAYGRIVRRDGRIVANVEARDATEAELSIREINAGVYVFDSGFLYPALKKVDNNNAQGEYYLTDLIRIAVESGLTVSSCKTEDPVQAQGVNTKEQLESLANAYMARVESR